MAEAGSIVRCDACPVLCRIREGKAGACDRYANLDGQLVRVDPLVVTERADQKVAFLDGAGDWDGELVRSGASFVTGIGAGTTYPDYKPAPFIVGAEVEGVDMVTVVSEGIFSYCGLKVKIDTDRFLGPERAAVRADGEPIGHVTTAEYGSQMLALGGVRHLTGGSKREGTVTCKTMLDLCSCKPVEVAIEDGATVVLQAGAAPVVNGAREERMRVGCGSATIGIFAKQWHGARRRGDRGRRPHHRRADRAPGRALPRHAAGRHPRARPQVDARALFPGRRAGPRLGRHRRRRPARDHRADRPQGRVAGAAAADGVDDRRGRRLVRARRAAAARAGARCPRRSAAVVDRIAENCEPALTTVLFMAGAGGSLRAGVTENPVRLTRSVKQALTRVTCGGAPVYVWPGGGITLMVDVTRMPVGSFGYVPTPALVAPIEFTLARQDYAALGGHLDSIVALADVLAERRLTRRPWDEHNPWPVRPRQRRVEDT